MTELGASKPPGEHRATRALIDLGQFNRNVRTLRSLLRPSTRLMAVVKANGYGHGAVTIAREAIAAGAGALAVATVGEGQALRGAGLSPPILVLSPIAPEEIEPALAAGLELVVGSPVLLDAILAAASRLRSVARLHLKVDTGMHRGGCPPDAALSLAQRISEHPALHLAGVMTHFAMADDADPAPTHAQAARFRSVLAALERHGIDPGLRHCANSAATVRFPEYHFDMVRPGIALYGLAPSPELALPAAMRPVLTLESRLARVERLPRGAAVGYGGTYRASHDERVGLVPLGYADGYRRSLSNVGWMAAKDQRLEILGRVSMDQTTVRLPAGTMWSEGDRVSVIGGTDGAPSIDDIARLTGTINYEVVTNLAARVPRHYVGANDPTARGSGTAQH